MIDFLSIGIKGFFISSSVSFVWSIFLSKSSFWYVTPLTSHSNILCKNVFAFLLNSLIISEFLVMMYSLNYLNSKATSPAINSAKWLTWSHKWFKLFYIGNLRSFRIGLSRYKKLFIEGNPKVLIVSNFFKEKWIFLSESY